MRNCTVWMCFELKIGGRMTILMYCVTLKRTLREEMMGGMKSVSPGFQELRSCIEHKRGVEQEAFAER